MRRKRQPHPEGRGPVAQVGNQEVLQGCRRQVYRPLVSCELMDQGREWELPFPSGAPSCRSQAELACLFLLSSTWRIISCWMCTALDCPSLPREQGKTARTASCHMHHPAIC